MRISSYISLLCTLILSLNQRRVLCRHVSGDTGGLEKKFKLPRDNENVHNPSFWHHLTGNDREQNSHDHNRIKFPDYETNNINACVSSCPTTSEYNPVCGTNNKTYTNPGKLSCAQECGVDVQLKYHFACPKTPTTTVNPLISTESPLPKTNSDTRVCINSCPTTSEYNPVCGSDGKTYYNIGKLDCAKYCGIDTQVIYYFACRKSSTTMANRAGSTDPNLSSHLPHPHQLIQRNNLAL